MREFNYTRVYRNKRIVHKCLTARSWPVAQAHCLDQASPHYFRTAWLDLLKALLCLRFGNFARLQGYSHGFCTVPFVEKSFVTGELLVEQGCTRDNTPGVGTWITRRLAKHQRAGCPQSHARQAKLSNSLILQYTDQIGHSLWSLATRFSRAGTMPRIG